MFDIKLSILKYCKASWQCGKLIALKVNKRRAGRGAGELLKSADKALEAAISRLKRIFILVAKSEIIK